MSGALPPDLTVSTNGVGVVPDTLLNTFVQAGAFVSDLRNFVGLTNMTVWLVGTATPGDGGQGMFVWDATATTADDDGATCVAPYGLLAGRWLRQSGGTSNITVVPNIAALRALSSGTSPVWVEGYYTPGDGGEGFFNTGTSASDNGGTVILSANGTYYREAGNSPLSIRWFGAKGDGTTNDTAAIQATLNVGNAWYVPPGTYPFTSVTIPDVVGFDFGGNGPPSILKQTGAGFKFATPGGSIFGALSTVHDLSFDGTAGTGHTFDATYSQQIDFNNLKFNEVPPSHAALYLNGNPGTSTYMHDVRVNGLRIYCSTDGTGEAGLLLGPLASDTVVSDFIMNGAFSCNYCVLANGGANNVQFENSHIYNAKLNIVGCDSGGGNGFMWTNVVFDNALGQLFQTNNTFDNQFSNCRFLAINAGVSGLVLLNSSHFILSNVSFETAVASAGYAAGCVTESGSSTDNKVLGGWIDDADNYADPFAMTGANDVVSNVVHFLTQNKGTATWSGTSTFVQAHGLATTPVDHDIWVQPLSSISTATYAWVDTINSTTFTINLSTSPAGTVAVGWNVRARNS